MDAGLIAQTKGGDWRQAPLDSPLSGVAGDIVEIDGTTAWLNRGGFYVASREIGGESEYDPQAFSGPFTVDRVVFFRRNAMPGIATTLVNASVDVGTGEVSVTFSDGETLSFPDFATLVSTVQAYDTNTTHAKNLLLLALVRRNPDGSNLDLLNGSSCTVDGIAAEPVVMTLTD